MTRPGPSHGLSLLLDEDRAEAAEWRHHVTDPTSATRVGLFNRYQPFAKRLAHSEWRRVGELGLTRSDCEQLAYEALLQAIDRFDPQRGVPFKSYARIRVQGSIQNGLAKSTEASAAFNARKRSARDRMRSLKQQVERDNSEPLDQLRELAVGLALGFMLRENSDETLDHIASADPSAYDAAAWKQLVGQLEERLQALPERERLILEYHYKQDIRFAEIATLLGVSKGRVSQLHSQALKRLRQSLSKFN